MQSACNPGGAAEGRLRWVHTMGQRARVRDACTRVRAWSVEHAAKARVAAPREQRDALGVRAGHRIAFPPHPPTARGGPQAQDQTTAAGDGATHQTRSGRGPRKGFLADTRWSNRGGSAARFRCRRSLRITSPCVIAAMIRSAPADRTGSAPYPAQRRVSAVAPSSSAAMPCRSPRPPCPADAASG